MRALKVPRFPTRTIVLMVLALIAFAWLWWRTRSAPVELPPRPVEVEVVGGDR